MLIASRRALRREERGAAALEFALVVPLLIVIVIAIVNFGALFAQQISVTNIAREAARNAVVDGPSSDCTAVVNDARLGAATVDMEADEPQIVVAPCPGGGDPVCTGSTPGQDVTVTVERPGQWLVPWPPLPGFLDPGAPALRAEGVMRCEFS